MNIHNYALTRADRRRIGAALRSYRTWAASRVDERLVIVAGDLNYTDGDQLNNAEPNRAPDHERRRDQAAPQFWQGALGRFMQVLPDSPTHFDVKRQRSTTLDRLFVTLPPAATLGIKLTAAVATDPATLSDRKLSDHGI